MPLNDPTDKSKPEHRPLEVISAEIDAINAQMRELDRAKTSLVIEHDEAAKSAGSSIPTII